MLLEGVNDPGIFKAVFLAGGPGSGKSFIVGQTALTSFGLKLVNSDNFFEAALKKAQMDMTPSNIFSPKGQEIRKKSVALTKSQMNLYLKGRLGLIIDGTGKNFDKIKGQAEELRKLGYDVSMIFVNTNLQTALDRNAARARSLPDDIVKKMWQEVQDNIGKFQNLFGRHMYVIDNSNEGNFKGATQSLYKRMGAWIKRSPENPIAKKWIKDNGKQMKEEHELNIEMAVKALHTLISSHKLDIPMEHHAVTISKAYNLTMDPDDLLEMYKDKYNITEEPAVNTTSVAGAGDDGIVAIDRRRRKDKAPRLLKRFSGWMNDTTP